MRLLLLLLFISTYCFGYVDTLTTIDGKEFKTDRNKVFILFWATWCGECKDKMKHDLPELSKKIDGDVVTINIDANIKRAKHYIRKRKPGVIVLRDESKKLINALGVGAVPHWALLERKDGEWSVIDHAVSFDRSKIDAIIK